MAKVYGYGRCSTNDTRQDVLRQERELRAMGAEDIRTEYVSGLKQHKQALDNLLSDMKEGDTLIVTEISRITRSTKQLCDIIDLVKEKHIKLVIKDSLTIDCTSGKLDSMTEAFLKIAGVFAELERNMISDRVKSGIANARAKGKSIGRPLVKFENIPDNVKKTYDLYINGSITKTVYAKICGISRPTLDKYLEVIKDAR
jgi:DNA invertase Pin-like site-specific DNA recombinase